MRIAGSACAGPRVWNDRTGEVGRTLSIDEFDVERFFGREGVEILHLSGLIAALFAETAVFCSELAKRAKSYGTRVSFDLNYRASFWNGREAELRAVFHEIASVSDILVGNEEDFQLALGIHGPEAGGKDYGRKDSGISGDDCRGAGSVSQRALFRHHAARGGKTQTSIFGARSFAQTGNGM